MLQIRRARSDACRTSSSSSSLSPLFSLFIFVAAVDDDGASIGSGSAFTFARASSEDSICVSDPDGISPRSILTPDDDDEEGVDDDDDEEGVTAAAEGGNVEESSIFVSFFAVIAVAASSDAEEGALDGNASGSAVSNS